MLSYENVTVEQMLSVLLTSCFIFSYLILQPNMRAQGPTTGGCEAPGGGDAPLNMVLPLLVGPTHA